MADHDGDGAGGGPRGTSTEALLAWMSEQDRVARASNEVARWRAAATRVRQLRGLAPTARAPASHQCDPQQCAPQNELAFGAAAARLRRAGVAPEPRVYVCREGAVHLCCGERYRPEGAPEFVPCRLMLHRGQGTCLITGRAHGTTYAGRGVTVPMLGRRRKRDVRAGATLGETNGDERPTRRRRTGSAALDPLVFGDSRAVLGEVAHPAALQRERAAQEAADRAAAALPATKRTRALAAALADGSHAPHRLTPTTTVAPTPAPAPPASPRRRRRSGRTAAAATQRRPDGRVGSRRPGPVRSEASLAAAAQRIAQLKRRPRRADCRELLMRVFYHPQRMQLHQAAIRDAFTRATKAQQERMEEARVARATGQVPPTHYEAAVAFVRAVRPVVYEQRPADQPSAAVLRYLETLLLLHWDILLASPAIRASPSRANFTLHCLTLLDCMRGPGYTWRGHLIVPPVDYVARYMPRDLEHLELRKRQFTDGMRTLREAYDAIPEDDMPLARLQRCIAGDEVRFAGTEWRPG